MICNLYYFLIFILAFFFPFRPFCFAIILIPSLLKFTLMFDDKKIEEQDERQKNKNAGKQESKK